MNNKIVFAPILALLACSAQAAMVWQPAPAKKAPQASAGAHAGHGAHGGGKAFVLQGSVSGDSRAQAELWLPTRVRRPLSVDDDGNVSVMGTGINSFHLLYAKREESAREEVAMRYLYLQGKPIEVSPSELVNAPKAALDITPTPLTREHQRYLSLKPVQYLVRFHGEPLAQQAIQLTTTNGSKLSAITDMNGYVTVELPDDFTDVQDGRSNNRPADFTIATSMVDDGRTYHTSVSAAYYVSPTHWQSFRGGLLAMFAGAISGLVVLKRSRNNSSAQSAGEA